MKRRYFQTSLALSVLLSFVLGCAVGPTSQIRQRRDQIYMMAQLGNLQDAHEVAMNSLAEAKTKYGDDHPEVAYALADVGYVHGRLKKPAAAEAFYRQALDILSNTYLDIDKFYEAMLMGRLAETLMILKRFEDADVLYGRAHEQMSVLLGADSEQAVRILNLWGNLGQETGDLAVAQERYARAVEISERKGRTTTFDYLVYLSNLAAVYDQQGQQDLAARYYERSLDGIEGYYGYFRPDDFLLLIDVARFYSQRQDYARLERLYRKGIDAVEKAFGTQHPQYGFYQHQLAETYRLEGKHVEAQALYSSALENYEAVLGRQKPQVVKLLNDMALNALDQEQLDQAEELFLEALAIADTVYAEGDEQKVTLYNNLAKMYRFKGQTGESQKYESLARQVQVTQFSDAESEENVSEPTESEAPAVDATSTQEVVE